MPLTALLHATSGHLQSDLDRPVELTHSLAGKPVWRWAFDALVASKLFSTITVLSTTPAILAEAKAHGAVALHADHDSEPRERPLLRVDVGAVLLNPDELRRFLNVAVGDTRNVISTSTQTMRPALRLEHHEGEAPPREVALSDRVEAARLLFNDWDLLEALVRRHGYRSPHGRPIRLLVSDVDGVMTDAGFYYDRTGQSLKKFSTRDGMGLVLIRDRIELGIITGEASGFAETRFGNLKITRIKTGTLDKLPTLDAWRQEMGLDWEEVAYVGDDLPDIPCMQAVGIAACPRDAEPEVKAVSDFVSSRRGGHGAVRDFINHLLAQGLVPPKKGTA
jgi:YrbI family 3-deoxy-D-manno-octulosonate 8-phosphate phosphatase